MIIINDSIPFGSFPLYYTGLYEQYYTVTGVDNDIKLIPLKGLNRILVPLFEQILIKEYTTKRSLIEKISDFVNGKAPQNHLDEYSCNWNKEIKEKKITPAHVVKLFEDVGCNELCVISSGESMIATGIKDGVSCCWTRQLGYLGTKYI